MKKSLPLLFLVAVLAACTEEPPLAPDNEENARVDAWIHGQLDKAYYWHDRLAAENSVSKALDPADYFHALLWSEDYFSTIEPADAATRGDAATGMIVDFGMQLMRWSYANTSAGTLQVMYLVPGSPAEKAGIRRGDLFLYQDLSGKNTVTLTRCDAYLQPTGSKVTVSKGAYYDTPVILDTVYEVSGGRKIGYLFYDRFESARGDGNDADLRAAIGRIRAKEADELILDLRYNGGGYLDISVELATMLLPAEYGAQDTYLYLEYATHRKLPTETVRFSNAVDAYRLAPERLHVITTGYTASASEITIHGLRQYREVTTYGERTVGKNVGSYEIPGPTGIPWNLHPISSRLYDRRGKGVDNWQTFEGLAPDRYFSELGADDEGKMTYYYAGTLGQYDPAKPDCDPLLNFVMNQLDYVDLLERPLLTRAAGRNAVPHFAPRAERLVIE